ncbi:dolichol-phosphate mannosyltransferase subunit 3 [Auriculariales sp. MPI-PUGE-AT-0066]|nr:dolichol-phosphate mannosyltransferase subunit 3 [Auriculariales sp. MPI-PUGE-AT-0066]
MTRATQLFTSLSILSTIYVGLLAVDVPEHLRQILVVLPWWTLVAFGSYSLWTLGWGMLSFRECPDAFHELTQEVDAAKQDLAAKGVNVD